MTTSLAHPFSISFNIKRMIRLVPVLHCKESSSTTPSSHDRYTTVTYSYCRSLTLHGCWCTAVDETLLLLCMPDINMYWYRVLVRTRYCCTSSLQSIRLLRSSGVILEGESLRKTLLAWYTSTTAVRTRIADRLPYTAVDEALLLWCSTDIYRCCSGTWYGKQGWHFDLRTCCFSAVPDRLVVSGAKLSMLPFVLMCWCWCQVTWCDVWCSYVTQTPGSLAASAVSTTDWIV